MSKTLEDRFWPKVKKTRSCWLWTAYKGRDGQGRISAGTREQVPLLAHRVSWKLFYGVIPEHHAVVHTCGILSCVRPGHLRLQPRGGPIKERFWKQVEVGEGCWRWKGSTNSFGYGSVNLGNGQWRRAHRLSWELSNGPIPDGLWVLHACDNPICVRPDHLFLGDHESNMQDMVAKGRSRTGERHHNSRLTNDDVRKIRRLHSNGVARRLLASQFNIVAQQVTKIVSRKAWRHVK